jgi:hypothetical protein
MIVNTCSYQSKMKLVDKRVYNSYICIFITHIQLIRAGLNVSYSLKRHVIHTGIKIAV